MISNKRWKVSGLGGAAAIVPESGRGVIYSAVYHYEDAQHIVQLHNESEAVGDKRPYFAAVRWATDDIQRLASMYGKPLTRISEKRARKFLVDMEERIREAICEQSWDILNILFQDWIADNKKGGGK